MADYNAIGTTFVVICGILGFIAILVLVSGIATSPKDSTSEIEKIQ
jgi:hypothetical protein